MNVNNVILRVEGERIDLYEDFPLKIRQKIQDFRDIKKVFTDMSHPITIPASKQNRKVFEDWHRDDLDVSSGAFDARSYKEATIEVNLLPFQEGYIEVIDAVYKNGQLKDYKIRFVGKLADLKQRMGDDTLQELFTGWSLDRSNTILSEAVKDDGNIATSAFNGIDDEVYPYGTFAYTINSSGKRLILDTEASASDNQNNDEGTNSINIPTRNLYASDGTTAQNYEGIDPIICKPSIKADAVLSRIESEYEIEFDRSEGSFFASDRWTDLYMLLHAKQDEEALAADSVVTTIIGWDSFSVGSQGGFGQGGGLSVSGTSIQGYIPNSDSFYWTMQAELTPPAGNEDTFTLKWVGHSGSATTTTATTSDGGKAIISFPRNSLYGYINGNWSVEGPRNKTVSVKLTITSDEVALDVGTDTQSVGTPNDDFSPFVISDNVPTIKTIKWLSGIWQMFNLTAYYDTDPSSDTYGKIVVKPLDDFYSDGATYDITKWVDSFDYTISKIPSYSNISYQWQDPNTFHGVAFDDQNSRQYGEEKWEAPNELNVRLINNQYDVQLPFSTFPYDATPGADVVYPYVADEGGSIPSIKPHFHYVQSTVSTGDDANKIFISGTTTNFTTYARASKYNEVTDDDDNLQPDLWLGFYHELDDYAAATNASDQTVGSSLFEEYHRNYVDSLFQGQTRVSKRRVKLPQSIVANSTMADRFVIGSTSYRQNSRDIDVFTGESTLELISGIEEFTYAQAEELTSTSTSTTSTSTSTASTSSTSTSGSSTSTSASTSGSSTSTSVSTSTSASTSVASQDRYLVFRYVGGLDSGLYASPLNSQVVFDADDIGDPIAETVHMQVFRSDGDPITTASLKGVTLTPQDNSETYTYTASNNVGQGAINIDFDGDYPDIEAGETYYVDVNISATAAEVYTYTFTLNQPSNVDAASYNINVTNEGTGTDSYVGNVVTVQGTEGEEYNFNVVWTADTGFSWINTGNIQLTTSDAISGVTLSENIGGNSTVYTASFSGEFGAEDDASTYNISGSAVAANATSVVISNVPGGTTLSGTTYTANDELSEAGGTISFNVDPNGRAQWSSTTSGVTFSPAKTDSGADTYVTMTYPANPDQNNTRNINMAITGGTETIGRLRFTQAAEDPISTSTSASTSTSVSTQSTSVSTSTSSASTSVATTSTSAATTSTSVSTSVPSTSTSVSTSVATTSTSVSTSVSTTSTSQSTSVSTQSTSVSTSVSTKSTSVSTSASTQSTSTSASQALGWNCVNSSCVQVAGGQYATLKACNQACTPE